MEYWRDGLHTVSKQSSGNTNTPNRLTGCFPFWSSRLTAQYRKIMAGVYSWPKSCFISETARDFVRRLLETDPTIRMTAVEAITHPWIAVFELYLLKA